MPPHLVMLVFLLSIIFCSIYIRPQSHKIPTNIGNASLLAVIHFFLKLAPSTQYQSMKVANYCRSCLPLLNIQFICLEFGISNCPSNSLDNLRSIEIVQFRVAPYPHMVISRSNSHSIVCQYIYQSNSISEIIALTLNALGTKGLPSHFTERHSFRPMASLFAFVLGVALVRESATLPLVQWV